MNKSKNPIAKAYLWLPKPTLRKKRVLHFQIHFLADDVDFAPEAANFRYSRYTWSEVYSLYVKSCKDLENKYITYPSFPK